MATDDTSAEAARVRLELMRAASVADRARLCAGLIEATRALQVADLRRRYPDASDEEIRRRLAFRLLSPDEVRAAYGWEPNP